MNLLTNHPEECSCLVPPRLHRLSQDHEETVRSMPEADPSADPAPPTAALGLADALASWPLRRRIAVAVLAPVLLVLMVATSGGWVLTTSPGWTALVVMIALACAATLATYLPNPGTGRRPDLGCTPCAAVAAVSVLAAWGVLSSAPLDVSTAVLALGISGFGLMQRLNRPSTCAN